MSQRTIAVWLVVSAVLAGVGASVLSARFGWPARLDDGAAVALPAFTAAAGAIRTGFTLELLASLALIPAIMGLGRLIGPAASVWTIFGVAGAFAQTLGWVRWPIAVPHLANAYAESPGPVGAAYDALNAYAGGGLGEYLGWLFMGIWAIGVGRLGARLVPGWLAIIGLALTVIWLPTLMIAGYQGTHAGAFATTGSLGYTLWLVWLTVFGIVAAVTRRSAVAAPDATSRN